MLKTALALLAGSIILIGVIMRVRTIDSNEFVSTVRITVFLFTAFAIGLFVVDAEASRTLASGLLALPSEDNEDGSISWLALFSFTLLPVVLAIVNGRRFSDAWAWFPILWAPPVVIWVATVAAAGLDDSGIALQTMQVVWFVGAATVFAFVHAVVGPVLAAFNLSLIVASLLGAGVFSVSLVDVFEWLGHLGVYSEALKWILLAGSTILGLHGTVSPSSIKDMLSG